MTNSGIRRWLGLVVVPLTLLMIGVSAPASAQTPTHKCDGDPDPFLLEVQPRTESNPEVGDIIVHKTDAGDCVISANDIHATGLVIFQVDDGNLIIDNAQNIRSINLEVKMIANKGNVQAPNAKVTAGRFIEISAGVLGGTADGSITTDDITSNTKDDQINDWNILIRAQKDVIIGDVKTNGLLGPSSSRSAAVQIDANLHGDNNGNLAIGGSSANVGLIDVRSVFGGEFNPVNVNTGVKITNGGPGSTGNITVADAGSFMVTHSQSRSGWIELNAQSGDINIVSGNFDVSGTSGGGDNMGGNVYLFAERIVFFGDTKIDASQSKNAAKSARQIILAASAIDYKAAGNLEILSDGNGISNSSPATIYFLPQGGINSNVALNVLDLEWTVNFNGAFFFLDKPLHFDGGTAADLLIRADGDAVQIAITGHPIIFDGKDITVQTKGDHNQGKHEIVMGFFGPANGGVGIDFGNTGTFEFFVRGEGNNAAGGDIQVQTPDKVIVDAAKLNLKANGPAQKPGDGGTIIFTTSEMTVSPTTKVKFIADASDGATGNAQILRNFRKAIFFSPGNSTIPVGKQVKQYSFSAMGGKTGGNGGHVEILTTGSGNKGIIRIRPQENVIDVSARGATGDGGQIDLDASNKVRFALPSGGLPDIKVALKATGGTNTGKGGEIILSEAFVIQSLPQPVALHVHAYMNVDAGPNEIPTSFHGSILIDTALCQQNKTPFATWPSTWWDCDNSTSVSADEQAMVNAAGGLEGVGNFSTLMNSNDVNLHVFSTPASYDKFIANPSTTPSIVGVSSEERSFIGVFALAGASQFMPGHAMHEIGHLVDRFGGNPSKNPPLFGTGGTFDTVRTNMQPPTTCFEVFQSTTFCDPFGGDAWQTFDGFYIQGQDFDREMWSFGFQECSGFPVESPGLDTAERSQAFKPIRDHFEQTAWPGGCRPDPQP